MPPASRTSSTLEEGAEPGPRGTDDAGRRRELVAWCIRHVGLPWGMILSGVAAGVTHHGSLASVAFAVRAIAFEVGGIVLGAALAMLAGRLLWRLGIGRHFAAAD